MSFGVSASHVPVLVYLAKKYKPKTVLEFGSGALSTNLFLDKDIYTNLTQLTSIEEDEEWFKQMLPLQKDNRFKLLNRVPPCINGYDMIFVDGPQEKNRRGKVIGFVMRDPKEKTLVVIHDIEFKLYRSYLNIRQYYEYLFDPVEAPLTGIYHPNPFPNKELNKVNRLMRKHFYSVQEDWSRWNEIL